jgi:hypothetical protein
LRHLAAMVQHLAASATFSGVVTFNGATLCLSRSRNMVIKAGKSVTYLHITCSLFLEV